MAYQLTNEQIGVANHPQGCFVEACPGAGKTRSIVQRIINLAADLAPRKGIAFISFTNAAVEEFLERCKAEALGEVLRFPSYVGTFDSFLRHFFVMPSGLAGVAVKPEVIDSWDRLAIVIHLPGRNRFKGAGVSLDKFDAETNQIDPETIGHNGLRIHVAANKAAYEQHAARERQRLRVKGYISAADVRIESKNKLANPAWESALANALAARFREIIVDEAQDCNQFDVQIIIWLRKFGIPVTVVADPGQAIYGFRYAGTRWVAELASSYARGNTLQLTGNFRCSPAICRLAATLRTREDPDQSLGLAAEYLEPTRLLVYRGTPIPEGISQWFLSEVSAVGIDPANAIVLAHKRRVASYACGVSVDSDAGGTSKVARVARAAGEFWRLSNSGPARERAIRNIEWLLLNYLNLVQDGESVSRAITECSLDQRWLRRMALEIVCNIPRTCADTDDACAAWVFRLQDEIRRRLDGPTTASPTTYFRRPPNRNWVHLLSTGTQVALRHSTVHESKGKEYDAVCMVIPSDQQGRARTAQMLESWEQRTESEAKRVVYVGATRAKKLLAIAAPEGIAERVIAILNVKGVPFAVYEIGHSRDGE